MSFSYWFVLITVHIAIPAVISFFIIFYTWRFFAWIREKFTHFRRKVDGYEQVKQQPKRRKHRRSNKEGKVSNVLMNRYYLMPKTLEGQRNPYEMGLEYKNNCRPITLNDNFTSRCYEVYKKQGEDVFLKWIATKFAKRNYSEMTYTSQKSVKEQMVFYKNYVLGDQGSMFGKEADFQTLCLFLELHWMGQKNLINWIKELPDRSKFSRNPKTEKHSITINFNQR